MLSPEQSQDIFARSSCLYDQRAVETAMDQMAEKMQQELANSDPLFLCVVIGGIVVLGNLLPRLNFPLKVDYIHVTRYRNALEGGALYWQAEPSCSLEGRSIVIVDDILDTGLTLIEIIKYCKSKNAGKVYSAVLIDKQVSRQESSGLLAADFTGLQVPDCYVYGYGMDYKGYLRNAAGIYAADD